MNDPANRYHRQTLLPEVQPRGQARLETSTVLIVGCGALGTHSADLLARAGVGRLRIADRDVVDRTNLSRQSLFDEQDARDAVPKAVAAAARLSQVNPQIRIDPIVCDVDGTNLQRLAGVDGSQEHPKCDLIVDGTDNPSTRYLINELSVHHAIPWVYGGCIGTQGRSALFRPPGACLRCVFPIEPSPGELDTCDTVGVLGPAAAAVGAFQASAAIRYLVSGESDAMLHAMDLWSGSFRSIRLDGPDPNCPTCGRRDYQRLGRRSQSATSLCGRNTVQIRPEQPTRLDLPTLAARLAAAGHVRLTEWLLTLDLAGNGEYRLSVFPDGRLMIHGTSDPAKARALAARYLGY